MFFAHERRRIFSASFYVHTWKKAEFTRILENKQLYLIIK